MSHPADRPLQKHSLRAGWFLLLAGVVATAIGADQAFAQPRNPPPAPATGRGGAKPAPTKKPATKAVDEPVDPLRLPTGYIVPPQAPEWLTTPDEWSFEPWTPQEFNQAKIRYNKLVADGELANDADKKLVENMVTWKLAQMTHRDNKESVYQQRNRLMQEIRTAGGVRGKRDVRILMLQVVADKAPRLFEYQFMVRLNGAILLAELSDIVEVEAEGNRVPAVHCIKAAKPMIDLLQQVDDKNHKQPEAVRTWLVDGLVRLAQLPELKSQTRVQITDVLTAQMASSGSDHEWLQWKFAEGLGTIGNAYDGDKKPTVAQVLAEALVDEKRPILVRAEAAQSLGKLNYSSDVDLSLIAHEVARLAQQVGRDYQKEPGRVVWQLAFTKLYLAFKPANDDEAKAGRGMLTQIGSKPALASHKKTVQDAFDVVLPLVQKVLNPQPMGTLDEPLTRLGDWLKANPPRRTGIADNLPPIINQSSSGAPAGTSTSSRSPTSG